MNNVSIPSIHASIEEKVRQLIENFNSAIPNDTDIQITIDGYLKSSNGVRIKIVNIESIDDDLICQWENIANKSGCIKYNYTINMHSGEMLINVEYKRPPVLELRCLIFPIILIIIWAILMKINPGRYNPLQTL